MADINVALKGLLTANAKLMTYVAGSIEPAYYLADDATFPAVCFWAMNNSPPGNHQGFSSTNVTMFQFRAFAGQDYMVRQIYKEIRKTLGGFIGTASGVTIQGIIPMDDRQIPQDDTTYNFGWEGEFKVFWVEDYS